MAEVWERQSYETPKQYALFCVYRDLGWQRSIRKAILKSGRTLKYIRVAEVWSSKYHWVERANQYDSYVDEQIRKQNEQDLIEMRKRHITQSMIMQKNVIERMQNTNPSELSVSDCTKMFDVAVKVERLARGCDDNSQKVEVQNNIQADVVKDITDKLSRLSVPELEEYQRLCEKMEGKEPTEA